MPTKQYITKESGEKEVFKEEKIFSSSRRAGASKDLAREVARKTQDKYRPGINSGHIYESVVKGLRGKDPASAARYSLKRAIMNLGPTGFPFEKYVSEILKAYGYSVEVGKIVEGYCVSHEIDVIAQKRGRHFMVECKYHNRPGIRSDIQVALYIQSRFLDVERAWREIKGHKEIFHQAWLVTNTKCTTEAIKYARCMNLRVIAWRYPKARGLEYFIEKKGLYPVTILSSIPKNAIKRLSENGLVLVSDLLKYSSSDLAKLAAIQPTLAKKIQEEASQIFTY